MYNNTIILSFAPLYLMTKNSFNGDTGNQKPLNPCNAPAALRVESRQTEPFKMPVPQRQNPKLTALL